MDRCIHKLFAEQVARTPDAIAVVYDDRQLTYRELNARANRLAHCLIRHGVGPDVRVGICAERSLDMIVGVLAIVKAGGAYVPLDPGYPRERLAFMLADAAAPVLLSARGVVDQLGLADAAGTVIYMDEERASLAGYPADEPLVEVAPEHLIYTIYTSGSTGRPKGVLIPHRALGNQLRWLQRSFPLGARDRFLLKTPFSFDASVSEIFQPLVCGAQLVIARPHVERDPAGLIATLARYQVTTVQVVPTLLRLLCQEPGFAELSSLKRIFCGGEALSTALVRDCLRQLSVEIVNLYGPTEACIQVTASVCLSDEPATFAPIGRNVDNTPIYIVDDNLQQVPPGVAGELCVAGVQLARGYLNRPELTAERFIANPFGDGRLYRTGDLARYRADGTIEFVGRRDQQIKIRGFRVELGEIEAVLGRHAGVREVAVVARQDAAGQDYLAAYVVSRAGAAVSLGALRGHLAAHVPHYMIPGAWVALDAIPVLPNGKVDRRALPAGGRGRDHLDNPFVAARSRPESQLAAIWQDVLGVEQVGIHDDFFEMGGHSLLATRMVTRVQAVLGVMLSLQAVFQRPTVAELLDTVQALQETSEPARTPLVAMPRPEVLPLSFAQQRLWFITTLERHELAGHHEGVHSTYNIPLVLGFAGKLDIPSLRRALNALVQRHESLRTYFPVVDGQPRQYIADYREQPLLVEPLALDAMDRVIAARWQAPFDLARGPLHRMALFELSRNEHILVWALHHSIADAWSTGVLVRECKLLYRAFVEGRPSPLRPLTVDYADYTLWQRARLTDEALHRELTYWHGQLAGMPDVLRLPTDRPRPPVFTFRGQSHISVLDPELVADLKSLGRRYSCTLFMTLLAAFDVLLYRYTGQTDFCVGSPVAHRLDEATENMVGFFVNTLVLRARVADDDSFLSLLHKVRQTCLDGYEHQSAPFESLVEHLQVERSLGHHPLFQVMFILQNTEFDRDRQRYDWREVQVSEVAVDVPTAKFDLILEIFDTGDSADGLKCYWEYSSDLFDRETIVRLTGHFAVLLAGACRDPHARVAALPLLPAAERRQLLTEWNDAADDDNWPERCVHQLFEAQAGRTPDEVAAIHGREALTYEQLNARSNQLAHLLLQLGVGPDVRVALCIERSLMMLIGVLGIIKAGGAYVPLDPHSPAERLRFMMADAGVAIAVTQATVWQELDLPGRDVPGSGSPGSELIIVALDRDQSRLAAMPATSPQVRVRPDTLVYVLYTSGSTGRPKGVCMEHRAVTNLVHWQVERSREIDSHRHTLQFASIGFDVSFQEIFATLAVGGRLVLVDDDVRADPEQLLRTLHQHGVTRLFLPYVALQQLIEVVAAGRELSLQELSTLPLREVISAGEALLIDETSRAVFAALPVLRLWNQYGPSEAHVVTAHCLDASCASTWPARPPIGRPIANVQIYILDRELAPVPVGVAGELCIGGESLARGYLNRPALTAEKFVANPFAAGRLYRTGDLARYRPDGTIEFLGRIDQQIKIRGFRVEPGEIEAVLTTHPSVRAAVVVARDVKNRHLAAYVTARQHHELAIDELRAHLQRQLPDYMLPSTWAVLDDLPLTASGKLDPQALPAPTGRYLPARERRVPPRTAQEELVIAIWREVLNVEDIGVHDNFFEIGGHSLLVVQLMHRVQQKTGQHLPLSALFRAPTVARFAALLDRATPAVAELVVPIQAQGQRPPLFLLHPGGGTVFCYHRLAQLLGPGQPVYGVRAFGTERDDPPALRSVVSMAETYRAAIRQVQVRGPYSLGGWSLGGTIAFEMARQWQAEGEPIAVVALLDSFATLRPHFDHWRSRQNDQSSADLERFSWHNLMAYFQHRLPGVDGALPAFDEPGRFARLLALDTERQLLSASASQEDERRLWATFVAGTTAAVQYQPGHYPGVLHVFQATAGFEAARAGHNGWAGRADRIVGREVAGSHFDFVDGPQAAQLARELRAVLPA